jgi:hypothetical protein
LGSLMSKSIPSHLSLRKRESIWKCFGIVQECSIAFLK